MLNWIWLALVVGAVLVGAGAGRLDAVGDEGIAAAKTAVNLAIGLIGVMALWMGLMRLAEKSGLVQVLAKSLRPALRRLFPDVPPDHPAMGSMLLNIAANMLGLANAATPLGLRAMEDLERLNRRPGTATNAMCTFLAINTSSVQLIPATAVAILASAGAQNPTAIVGTAFAATVVSTFVGIVAVKLLERLPVFALPPAPSPAEAEPEAGRITDVVATFPEEAGASPGSWLARVPMILLCGLFAAVWVSMVAAPVDPGANWFVRGTNALSALAIPFLLAFFPLHAATRKIPVYEEFVEGAKEGFQVAVKIIPFLVAMLVAIGMFRGAGAIEWLTATLRGPLAAIGFPAELLPLSLVRPLSGSASLGLFSDLVAAHGPDSLIARTAGSIFGSTETTFYVIAVYFGSVGVKRTRHAVPAGLLADLAGIIASVIICRAVFA